MKTNTDRQQLDSKRSQAAQYFVQNFSREKRYLIILSRDLQNEFDMIQNLCTVKSYNSVKRLNTEK